MTFLERRGIIGSPVDHGFPDPDELKTQPYFWTVRSAYFKTRNGALVELDTIGAPQEAHV